MLQRKCSSVLGIGFSLLLFCLPPTLCHAAQLLVIEQQQVVLFSVAGQQGDAIALEKADLSLMYGLELELWHRGIVYSLAGQEPDFDFPAEVTVLDAMVLGRRISKSQLAALFRLKQTGRYKLIARLCLSGGVCLQDIQTELVFSAADFPASQH